MKFHILLSGCRPRPLASYLKAIGILRLLNEQQRDTEVRGCWKGDVFHLYSSLTENDITEFLLREYKPTPMVTPWNGGSGFYPKDQKKGIDPIQTTSAVRFRPYQEGIKAAFNLIRQHGDPEKSPKDETKFKLLREARKQWRGPLADWLNAALVIDSAGEPLYPAILGTGGNDGRLDFTNNFMQRLVELFDMESETAGPTQTAIAHLNEALFGEPVSDLKSVAIGQFDPGSAGGTNSSNGFHTASLVNLWDFVLMLEGAIAFAPALVRRANGDGLDVSSRPKPGLPQAAAPFAVYNAAAGYATAVGDEKSRGEQWMPIWERPTGYSEFKEMLSQARCRVGSTPAKRPRDVAKAIARQGCARGITAFERFAYLERNGQANLATPLGRWNVGASDNAYLLDEIEEWLNRFDRASNAKTAPASWGRHARIIDSAVLSCCKPNATPSVWSTLAASIGAAEAALIHSPQATAKSYLRPLWNGAKPLSSQWITAISDKSAETRLAVALACQYGPKKVTHRLFPNVDDPIRQHFIPLETRNGDVIVPPRFGGSDDRLILSNDVVVRSSNIERDLARMVQRRLLLFNQRNDFHFFPLVPCFRFEANISDVASWIEGRVDSQRIVNLARFLMAVNWRVEIEESAALRAGLGNPSMPTRAVVRRHTGWALTRLCFHWQHLTIERKDDAGNTSKSSHSVTCDASVFSKLLVGDGRCAVQRACRRLRSAGICTKLSTVVAPANEVRRWAGSIAWSLSDWSMNKLAQEVLNIASIRETESSDVAIM